MTLFDKAFKGISMPQFYKWGSILFSVGIIGSIINFKMQWALINLGGKISMFSSILFQCLLLSLFLTLYFQIKKQTKVINNPELDNFLKELQDEDKKDKPKKKESIFETNLIKKSILQNVKGGSKKDG